MPESGYIALFLVGLLGGSHCVGMCGGIVGALSMGGDSRLVLHLSYNTGRLVSYGLAGALVGALGEAGLGVAGTVQARWALYFVANLMLVALGLYLMGVAHPLAFAERAGRSLWRRLQPFSKHFLPVRHAGQAFPLGVLWGWLPCGLVYSALATALSSGSWLRGAGLMLAFGLGTLPNLLLAGMIASRLNEYLAHRVVRIGAGLVVLTMGGYGIVRVLAVTGFFFLGDA